MLLLCCVGLLVVNIKFGIQTILRMMSDHQEGAKKISRLLGPSSSLEEEINGKDSH